MAKSKIHWTDNVWNYITGCTPKSAGCNCCYAKRMAKRLRGRFGYPEDDPFKPGTVHPDKLHEPSKWKKPSYVFVSSMGDLFHDAVVNHEELFEEILRNPHHVFLLLTKRPERMSRVLKQLTEDMNGGEPFSNVWVGISAENKSTAVERLPHLLETRAVKRFVSFEPLLGPINIKALLLSRPSHLEGRGIDWIIVGGQTGPRAQPLWCWNRPYWVEFIRDCCIELRIPFWFKQWGKGKKGNELDGKVWEERPDGI